jgi:hypothetical protein
MRPLCAVLQRAVSSSYPQTARLSTSDRTRSSIESSTSKCFAPSTSTSISIRKTSPISGERYRLEASPTFGALTFTNLLVDYRRYLMPAPFYTIAARVIHDGRYGSGGEDQRIFPMYIGYPALVRGYDINTFGPSDCVPSVVSQCPAFDRLLGSRMLVGNLEFLFPLLRPFGATSRMYGPIPIEVALFADGGVAWNRGQTPALFGGSREGVVGRCCATRKPVRLRGRAARLLAALPAARKRLGGAVQPVAGFLGKSQIPNPKFQIPNPEPHATRIFGDFRLGLGIWNLGFGISSCSPIRRQIRPELARIRQV